MNKMIKKNRKETKNAVWTRTILDAIIIATLKEVSSNLYYILNKIKAAVLMGCECFIICTQNQTYNSHIGIYNNCSM